MKSSNLVSEGYRYQNWRPIWDIYPSKDEEGFTRYTIPYLRRKEGNWPLDGDKRLREAFAKISDEICVDFKEIQDPR